MCIIRQNHILSSCRNEKVGLSKVNNGYHGLGKDKEKRVQNAWLMGLGIQLARRKNFYCSLAQWYITMVNNNSLKISENW